MKPSIISIFDVISKDVSGCIAKILHHFHLTQCHILMYGTKSTPNDQQNSTSGILLYDETHMELLVFASRNGYNLSAFNYRVLDEIAADENVIFTVYKHKNGYAFKKVGFLPPRYIWSRGSNKMLEYK